MHKESAGRGLLSVKAQKWESLPWRCDAAQSPEKMTKVCREDKSLPREYITSTRAVQSAAAACCQEGIKSTARAVQVHVKSSVVHWTTFSAEVNDKYNSVQSAEKALFSLFRIRHNALTLSESFCAVQNVTLMQKFRECKIMRGITTDVGFSPQLVPAQRPWCPSSQHFEFCEFASTADCSHRKMKN